MSALGLGRVSALVVAVLVATGMSSLAPAVAAPTTIGATSSPSPSVPGQDVTLTATVSGTTPTGSVTFTEGGAPLGVVAVSAGVAQLVVTGWGAGTHAVTAAYSGDADDDPSAVTLLHTVTAPIEPPKVRLRVSDRTVSVGDKVRLTWRSRRADTVTASGDWAGSRAAKGSARVRITERGKHVFKLTVENVSGRDKARVRVVALRKAKELELVVTDELVLVGAEVEVAADGLARGESFTIRLDGTSVATGKADRRGEVHRVVRVPKSTPEGALPLTITGSNHARVGAAVLNVIRAKELSVSVEKPSVRKNGDQQLTVVGLAAGETVTVTYAGRRLTVGHADERGQFRYTFDVGDQLGDRTVRVVGEVPSRTGDAEFTVVDHDPDQPPQPGRPAAHA